MTRIATGQQTVYDINDIHSDWVEPQNPNAGMMWLNKNDWNVYTWNGSSWILASPNYQIGGRNLLRNTSFDRLNYWGGSNTVIDNDFRGKKSLLRISTGATDFVWAGLVSYVQEMFPSNSTYTVSSWVYIYSDINLDGGCALEIKGVSQELQHEVLDVIDCQFLPKDTWHYVEKTFTVNKDYYDPYFFMWVGMNGKFKISMPKIEKGNKATDWTPAPEDSSEVIEEITATLGNMANDNILDFKERQLVKDKLIDILGYALADSAVTLPMYTTLDSLNTGRGSFYTARQSALNAGILPTNGIYDAVAYRYTDLKNYLESLEPIKPWDCTLANNTKTISVVKETFTDKFLQFYKALNELASYTSQKLKENADNIKVGGTNLLLNSKFNRNSDYWNNVGGVITQEDGYNCIKIQGEINTSKYVYQVITDAINENPLNTEYTLSAWVKATDISLGTVNPIVDFYLDGFYYGNNNQDSWMGTYNVKSDGTIDSLSGRGWVKLERTIALSQQTYKPHLFSLYIFARDFTGTICVRDVKFEIGNRATDWSPHPSDVDVPNVVSKFTMDANSMDLLSQNINLTGKVTFNSLAPDLKPIITDGESAIFNSNYNFIDWSSTLPTGYQGLTGTAPTKVTSDNKTGLAVRHSTSAGVDNYFQSVLTTNKPYSQYVYVESTFKLESGTLSGSGILFRYMNTSGGIIQDLQVNFGLEIPSPVVGKWYTVSKVFKMSSANNSSFASYTIFPMASYSAFNTSRPAKVIQFDSVKARPATQSEIISYEMNTTTRTANGVTYIDGGRIITDNINTLSATVGTLTGGRIYGAEIEGARMYTSNTPSFWDANFTERLSMTSGRITLEARGLMGEKRIDIDGYGIEIDGKTGFGDSPNDTQRVTLSTSGIAVNDPTYPTSKTLTKKTFGISADEIYFGHGIMENRGKLFMGSWDSGQLNYNGANSLTHSPKLGNDTPFYIYGMNGIVIDTTGTASSRITMNDTGIQINDRRTNGATFTIGKAGDTPLVSAKGIWERGWSQNTSNVPVLVNASGTLARDSSASKYKLVIEEAQEDFKKILNLKPKTWFDKYSAEQYAKYLTKKANGEDIDIDGTDVSEMKRVWGLIAEDLVEAGLEQFTSYTVDENGNKELEGISYSHLWIMLIPLVKELYEKIEQLENNQG